MHASFLGPVFDAVVSKLMHYVLSQIPQCNEELYTAQDLLLLCLTTAWKHREVGDYLLPILNMASGHQIPYHKYPRATFYLYEWLEELYFGKVAK